MHLQRRRDDQHFVQAILVGRRQNHPRDPRIDRQLRLSVRPRSVSLMLLVDRTQLEQRVIAIANGLGSRRIEKRKVLDIAQPSALACRITAARLLRWISGDGEAVAGKKILFAVKPHADARPDAAATPFALIGRSLRYRLDRQPLHLGARRIAADAGRARCR